MKDFEKLGLFYLGRRYDLAAGQALDEPVLCDSRDLVTHAVCVGRAIYTPGSRAGIPVSIVTSFAAPPAAARGDAELMAERASTTATSVLWLAGVDAPHAAGSTRC